MSGFYRHILQKLPIYLRVTRIVDPDKDLNTIILPTLGEFIQPQTLQKVFGELSVTEVYTMEEDIAAAVMQLQLCKCFFESEFEWFRTSTTKPLIDPRATQIVVLD